MNLSTIARDPIDGRDAVRAGLAVCIRPVTTADAAAMADFLTALDAASRRLRFHGALNPRAESLLRGLTQADGRRHAAWIAVVRGDDGREQVVGEARYVRDAEGSAEIAMAVAASWRGCGLADRLLATLTAHARRAGVRRLTAEVLPENARMRAFLRRQGYAETAGLQLDLDSACGDALCLACTLAPLPPGPRRMSWQATAGRLRRGLARLFRQPLPA